MGLLSRLRGEQAPAPAAITATITGDVSGQVAIGEHIVQVQAAAGAIVNVAAPQERASVHARATPVALRPRDFAGLLGRERETALVLRALADGLPVELHGPGGAGKTSLLRRLSHDEAAAAEHGVVFVRAAGESPQDVAQALFEALFESDRPFKPTPVELRRHLQDRRALVVVDDLACERDELAELLGCAPACRFLLASTQRLLWGEGVSHALGGLAPAAALTLLERELGRGLGEGEEHARAIELCRLLDGRPLSVLQAAELARAGGELPRATPGEVERTLRARLGTPERRALAVLELLAPATVRVDDVAAIAELPDAAAALERLGTVGAAQTHSPRWSATLAAAPAPDAGVDVRALSVRAARVLGGEQRLPDDHPAILAALRACADAECWQDVTALARASERRLALSGRWGAWEIALDYARAAARADSDRASEAWALHQLGTRAGCLGDVEIASDLLGHALALRQELGDATGVAASTHNLEVFHGGAGGGGSGQQSPPQEPRGPSLARVLAIGAVVLATGAGAAALIGSREDAGTTPAKGTHRTTTTQQTSTPSGRTTTSTPSVPTTTSTPATNPLPALAVNPTQLSFDTVPVGGGTSAPLLATNLGSATITIGAVTVTGAGYTAVSSCAGQRLAPGARCAVRVTFAPTATGESNGTLSFGGTATSVPLTGSGITTRPPPIDGGGPPPTTITTTTGPAQGPG